MTIAQQWDVFTLIDYFLCFRNPQTAAKTHYAIVLLISSVRDCQIFSCSNKCTLTGKMGCNTSSEAKTAKETGEDKTQGKTQENHNNDKEASGKL